MGHRSNVDGKRAKRLQMRQAAAGQPATGGGFTGSGTNNRYGASQAIQRTLRMPGSYKK